ncbi:putative flippase GtrA [Paenibacillus cellulosilyticus]|uniref:Putative flippase GtrA n=1 Tax=Paenibacillus cellulosilyticus TaxID=375489 RepID=A0A2V2Z0Z9_9BACL|nr:bifunctional glycosyltransferase family 2/GtrA family protein [Paenibacillus cellulosilyticus]PWW06269.1 putative flippase GtrA [Paenibacillus cellulosilyticus]QKS42979.1 bifunctional glycosyltransferase family 2/GtrA family protein [Paenibacillus cellulosilyticus]
MTVLIPSYEPDARLIGLIHQLIEVDTPHIVIVDDGSGDDYRSIFATAKQLGCTVLTHEHNMGKGRALKTGFQYIKKLGRRDGVICADSDGQHLPADIMRIADAVDKLPHHIVLGSRQFTGEVPLRSRFGNTATRKIYKFTTGSAIHDTQTGLRGFSNDMLDWLCSIPGDRFEYEMNMLLKARSAGYRLKEIPIETVYLEENKSSHFRPLADSIAVYLPILKFSGASLLSAAIDYGMLLLIHLLTTNLLLAVVGARVCSSLVNYTMNRRFVFTDEGQSQVRRSMPKYFALVLLILTLNYGLMYGLNEVAHIPLLISKLITEGVLFLFSYWTQRKFVYHETTNKKPADC